MINKILFIGATGMIGRPVAEVLSNSGFEVTALVRNPTMARNIFGSGSKVKLQKGDLREPERLSSLLKGHDAIYLNLSVKPGEKKDEFHTEGKGLESIIKAAQENKILRIAYLSSLVKDHESNWWVFQVKRAAVEMLKNSGIPYTIYYPSTFMEAIPNQFLRGKKLVVAGKPKYPMNWIAARDFGKQVANSFQKIGKNKEYIIQGPEPVEVEEALKRFISAYKKEQLKIGKIPTGLLKFTGLFSKVHKYGFHIMDAMNNYPERFQAEETWTELGEPEIRIEQFAEKLSQP